MRESALSEHVEVVARLLIQLEFRSSSNVTARSGGWSGATRWSMRNRPTSRAFASSCQSGSFLDWQKSAIHSYFLSSVRPAMAGNRLMQCLVCDKWTVWMTPNIKVLDLEALPIGEGHRCHLASLVCSAIMAAQFYDFDKYMIANRSAVEFSSEGDHSGLVRIEIPDSWYFEVTQHCLDAKWCKRSGYKYTLVKT